MANIFKPLPEQQTPSLDFLGLDLDLYTKFQQVKKKYSKLFYSLQLVSCLHLVSTTLKEKFSVMESSSKICTRTIKPDMK